MVPLRKHWESTSVIGCSVFVVNHDWLQLQLQSKMAEVLTQSGPQVVFHTPRNIKVASCLILIVTIHVQEPEPSETRGRGAWDIRPRMIG